ncbi:Short chain dehydrogenase atnD [Colletotrichum sp. SAR11_57]|nr:Short chain dehydrogenase atnD [Colletotrichum sp. SAR11_57]
MTLPSFFRSCAELPLPPASSIAGGTYIVTGSNTGLGYHCAQHLIHLHAARVILAVRSPSKGEAALASIRAHTNQPDAGEVWELDLASLASVEAFCTRLGELDRLDGLVANASVALDEFVRTGDGLETMVGVNVVGNGLLAVRALPKLRETAGRFGVRTCLSVVSSGTAFFTKGGGLDAVEGNLFESLSREEQRKTGLGAHRYPLSKLMQVYMVRHLASLLPVSETGVVINVLDPGICATDLARNMPWFFRAYIGVMRVGYGISAEQGSRKLLHGVTAGEASHGAFLAEMEVMEVPAWVEDEAGRRVQARVWDGLVEVLGKRGYVVDVGGM